MFLENFDNKDDVAHQFALNAEDLKGVKILFAVYNCGDYEGQAFVVFRKNRKLYEVNGSHCSCYGLEGQFEPEETNVKALTHRLEKGALGYSLGGHEANFRKMLDSLKRKPKVSS